MKTTKKKKKTKNLEILRGKNKNRFVKIQIDLKQRAKLVRHKIKNQNPPTTNKPQNQCFERKRIFK